MFLNIERINQENIAIIDDSGLKITYGDLCCFVKEVEKLELKRSVLFCMCENNAGALAGMVAFESTQVVPLLLSSVMEKGLLDNLHDVYQPAYYWLPSDTLEKPKGEVIWEKLGYSLIKTENPPYEINNKLSLLMTTSGSTGSPKLVRYKYGNLEANARNVAKAFGWTAKERCIADLPIQYTMGLNVINSHLVVGATILLIKSNLMSLDFWNFIKEQKGTNFTGVPYSYEILTKLRFTRMDLPDLLTIAEGGGKLTDDLYEELARYARENGKRFCPTFGTTETSARMAFCPPDMSGIKLGTIGKAIPEGELLLINDEGKLIDEIEAQGELVYRGPNVTMGYAECKEDLAKGDEWQGEYNTGDIARRDIDGFYYIVGRKKRFIKLFGLRISLDQCESIIRNVFNIDCACVGNDSRLLIYVDTKCDLHNIERTLGKKIGVLSRFITAIDIDCLPRNSNGKIMYSRLSKE